MTEPARDITPDAAPAKAVEMQTDLSGEIDALEMPKQEKTESMDSTQIPELPELIGLRTGRALKSRLKPEQQKLAEDIAARTALDDAMEIASFGGVQQRDAKKVIKLSGQLIREDARIMELGEVGELANEFRKKLEDLGVGHLAPKWYDQVVSKIPILGKQFDRLGGFLQRYEKMTTRLEDIFRAMQEEKTDLDGLHSKAKQIREVQGKALENLTVAAAAVEVKLEEKEREFAERMKAYKGLGALDDDDLEAITDMRNTLSALDRKLVNLKVMRVETRHSMRTMRDLMDAMVEASSVLDDQLVLQESVWRNQINNAIMEYKLRGVNGVIKNSREFTNRLLQTNQQNISSTLTELKQLAGEPGVDVAVLKGVIDSQRQVHERMLEISVENRRKLSEAAAAADKLDTDMAEDGQDLNTLIRMLEQDE